MLRRHHTFTPDGAICDLFAWADTLQLRRGGRPRTNAPRVKFCIDCHTPISIYSRGRCEACAYKRFIRPTPPDFVQVLKAKGSRGAAAHYHASLTTITRWRAECGLIPYAQAKRRRAPSMRLGRSFIETPLVVHRDFSLVGQAADFLRASRPMYRCDENGRQNPKGEFWRNAFSVMTDDEMMARARRAGWKPVEW
jgi:DNA-directed RNA polymerase subunit RPC12/RpoP